MFAPTGQLVTPRGGKCTRPPANSSPLVVVSALVREANQGHSQPRNWHASLGFHSTLLRSHLCHALMLSSTAHVPCGPLCKNMTSSTKPELHNVLYCHQRKIEPWLQFTCIENFVKCGQLVCRATAISNMQKEFGKDRECGSGDILTDRQTNTHTDVLITILCSRSRWRSN